MDGTAEAKYTFLVSCDGGNFLLQNTHKPKTVLSVHLHPEN